MIVLQTETSARNVKMAGVGHTPHVRTQLEATNVNVFVDTSFKDQNV